MDERPLREREPAWEMEGAAEMVALHRREAAAETGNSMEGGRRCRDGSAYRLEAAAEAGACVGDGRRRKDGSAS